MSITAPAHTRCATQVGRLPPPPRLMARQVHRRWWHAFIAK